jgi:hypothetical protein
MGKGLVWLVVGRLVEVALEVQRRLIVEGGMKSGRIVEGVHVIEGEELELIARGDESVGEAFGFEGGPKALPRWGKIG